MGRSIQLLLCGLATVLLVATDPAGAADDWSLEGPHPWYAGRYGHAMSYIAEGKVLMFGGSYGADLQDTWVYDLASDDWSPFSPALKPAHRLYHAMAHIEGDKVLLFGGYDPYVAVYGDTWVFDLSDGTWTEMNPPEAPSNRFSHQLVAMPGDQVLLYGGDHGFSGVSDETWIYDLSENTWTQMTPPATPGARASHSMASLGGDKALLFAGGSASSLFAYGDATWVYDLSDDTWTEMSPSSHPIGGFGHAMAHIGQDRAVLFGGYGRYAGQWGEPLRGTWIYDLSENSWTEEIESSRPSARVDHAMAETSADGSSEVVLFAGSLNWTRDSLSTETWLFGGGDHLVGNTPPGTDVEICDPGGQVCVEFPEVTEGGNTTIEVGPCGSPPEGIFLTRNPLCVNIETEAGWSGEAEVCIPYDDTGLTLPQEATLVMVRCNDLGQCENITASRDLDANILCGLTDEFSLFAVGEPHDSDGDFVPDLDDNCREVVNFFQEDHDAGQDDDSSLPGVQHYGNACDADLDNDGLTGPGDFFSTFRPCLGQAPTGACAKADLDGDGTIGPADFFGVMRPALGSAPGPGSTEP